MINQVDTEREIITITELYNAFIEIEDGVYRIHYPVLGDGSAIADRIYNLLGDRISHLKLIPTDLVLEVEAR